MGQALFPRWRRPFEWKDYASMVYTNDEDALKHWPNECKEVTLEYLKTSTKMVKKIVQVLFEHLAVTLDEPRIDALIALKMVNMNFYPTCPNPTSPLVWDATLIWVSSPFYYKMALVVCILNWNKKNLKRKESGWRYLLSLILSNGRYKSAEHRVRTTSTQSRVSIPIFTIPQPTEKIGPLPELVERDGMARYREFIFEDYMNNFFGKAHQGKKSLDFAQI
ncbi:2-oxoglutarate (2OG) and Fe(II)-dependent oxygenase superfamily protein [Actinidia rufa]|uniref:2-oxoglutarate (2OG) and Fe(II)-dependent oxygenase superfamily protein n=1 Tax=Actinidia rufa TaxID=165716 RepID=A0A7J0G961_9ERIC|nr:2-oxoglutarate (2OG) and Fe(II)-dependent oxygenase superfamily protein [Actinidia rufa]